MTINRHSWRARTKSAETGAKVTSRAGFDEVAQKNWQAGLPRQYRWWLLAAAVMRVDHGMVWR